MRYVINDDDFEDWIEKLKDLKKDFDQDSKAFDVLDYVVSEMEIELSQHRKTDDKKRT